MGLADSEGLLAVFLLTSTAASHLVIVDLGFHISILLPRDLLILSS